MSVFDCILPSDLKRIEGRDDAESSVGSSVDEEYDIDDVEYSESDESSEAPFAFLFDNDNAGSLESVDSDYSDSIERPEPEGKAPRSNPTQKKLKLVVHQPRAADNDSKGKDAISRIFACGNPPVKDDGFPSHLPRPPSLIYEYRVVAE